MWTFELPRSAPLSTEHWNAIDDALHRLERAASGTDFLLIVGCAKELCESVTKVVLASRSSAHGQLDFGQLVTEAHRSLDSVPNEGRAADEPMRAIVHAARKLVIGVGRLRNDFGTGHGRAVVPPVTVEHATLAIGAALIWCRWALTRLDAVLANTVDALVMEVEGSGFRRGLLTQRLYDIGLNTLPDDDAERLGRAVAQRGGRRETFVVWGDGVRAAAERPSDFPAAYRRGLVSGLFFDPNGYLRTSPLLVTTAASIAASLDDLAFVERLRADIDGAVVGYGMSSANMAEVAEAVRAEATRFPDLGQRSSWLVISERFEPDDDALPW